MQTLTALDRCDRCGARAEVLRLFRGGELLFCGHHFREHEAALDKQTRLPTSTDTTHT